LPSRLRVPFGYALGGLALILARPSLASVALGLPLALMGEGVRVWASGHIDKTQQLATGGPYAHTRNPLYLGSLLLGAGAAVAMESVWVLAAVLVYFLAFYPRVIREEALFLSQKFSLEYAEWGEAVPLFFPRFIPAGPRRSRFDWARVRSNREWRTAAAVVAILGLLLARGLLFPR